MRDVYLHGKLKKEFGPKYRFEVATAAEALRALNCAFPGRFVAVLKEGHYRIVRGDRHSGIRLDLELTNSLKLGNADLHIIPVAAGASKGKGTVKVIAGAALVGGAIFMSGGALLTPISGLGALSSMGINYGSIAALGLGVALQGVATLAAKAPVPPTETNDETSFSFSGPLNTNEQGNPVPVVFGELIVGSQTVSAGLDVEDIGSYRSALQYAFDATLGAR